MCFFVLSDLSYVQPPIVEAHSPFVQCVAWGPTPVTEGSDDSDRIVNVVATGGTDKVRLGSRCFWVVFSDFSQLNQAHQNLETLIV